MQEEAEKVEFFHSESSFGSESNSSESRYVEFNNELITETDNVFTTLRKELLPNQSLNNTERLDYAIRRAQILHKDSLPEQIHYLRKITAPESVEQAIVNSHRKVGKLLQDYDLVTKGHMSYKDFYNAYGKEYGIKDNGFSRKKEHLEINFEQDAIIKPQYIEISYGGERQKLRGSTPRVFMGQALSNDKETAALKEEVYQLKKNLEDTRKKYELERTNERLSFERRLKVLLNSSSGDQSQKQLRGELNEKSEQLTNLLNHNKQLQLLVEQKNKAIEGIKNENASLKEQIVVLRKTDNTIDYQQSHNKSYNSETNEISADKRNEKKIKNLLQENQLLKNQLKTERQRLYRLQSDLTEQQKRELQRSKKTLEIKSKQLEELYLKYDQQRIEILQLTHNAKSASKIAQSLKRENQIYKSKIDSVDKKVSSVLPVVLSLPEEKPMEISRKVANKIQILEYEGDGVQGFAYYESLSKEFRVRFRRACFREKELLYKINGIEIGVITNFEPPNKISTLIHITNYSEGLFQRLKGKIINANDNKIQGQEFEHKSLPSNEQIKQSVSLTITQYPIGPLILLLQYEVNDKKEEIRILLPAHIFKTMVIQQRSDNLASPIILSVIPERKICKELNDLRGYMKLPKREGPIRVSFYNEHTHTLIAADILQTREGLQLAYEHKEGNRKITEYFMKTFAFLLRK